MSDISDQETPTDQTVPTHRGLARLSRDEAHRLSVELVKHYPTTGMRASMGVTCQCGFHETRNLRRRSGNDGLDVHRAETAMSIPPSPERAILTDLIAELRDEHGKRPHPLVGGSDMCQSCGVTFTVNGYCPTWHITDRAEARLKGL